MRQWLTLSSGYEASWCIRKKKRFLAQRRRGAKRYRVSEGLSLRLCLCAFASLRERSSSLLVEHGILETKTIRSGPRPLSLDGRGHAGLANLGAGPARVHDGPALFPSGS